MVAIQLLNLAFAGNPAKVQQVNVIYLLFLYASSPLPSPCSVQSLRAACSDQARKRCRAKAGTADPADPDRRRIDKQQIPHQQHERVHGRAQCCRSELFLLRHLHCIERACKRTDPSRKYSRSFDLSLLHDPAQNQCREERGKCDRGSKADARRAECRLPYRLCFAF